MVDDTKSPCADLVLVSSTFLWGRGCGSLGDVNGAYVQLRQQSSSRRPLVFLPRLFDSRTLEFSFSRNDEDRVRSRTYRRSTTRVEKLVNVKAVILTVGPSDGGANRPFTTIWPIATSTPKDTQLLLWTVGGKGRKLMWSWPLHPGRRGARARRAAGNIKLIDVGACRMHRVHSG